MSAHRAHWILGAVVTGLCACVDQPAELRDAEATVVLAASLDGAWVLNVDRALRVAFPNEPLSEADYGPPSMGRSYAVVVSGHGQRVSIGDTPWLGTRDSGGHERVSYDLTEGVFAGGRFVVWSQPGGLQAELTLYGSGVPIAQSERGELTNAAH